MRFPEGRDLRRGRGIPATLLEKSAMQYALSIAADAGAQGEIPVGAAVIDADGLIIGSGSNTREATGDPAGHAEIVALREALESRREAGSSERLLDDCTLVVTLEPCVMCAGAILGARVARVVFGAWDDKAGGCGSVYDILRDGRLPHPVPEVAGGVNATESARLLQEFFQARR